jgi:hypothetical protein
MGTQIKVTRVNAAELKEGKIRNYMDSNNVTTLPALFVAPGESYQGAVKILEYYQQNMDSFQGGNDIDHTENPMPELKGENAVLEPIDNDDYMSNIIMNGGDDDGGGGEPNMAKKMQEYMSNK